MAICRIGIAFGVLCTLAACGGGEPQLMRLTSDSSSPDEFGILPGKPLEIPKGTYSAASLPMPTPGGVNRTDPTPQADAIAALGGNPAVLTRASTDGTLLAYSERYGSEPAIRPELAVMDADYRSKNGPMFLERWFKKTTYFDAYSPFALDQQVEQRRWEAAGAKTAGAPAGALPVAATANDSPPPRQR